MGGLVLDVYILALYRFLRRKVRIRKARQWPLIPATLEDWTSTKADDEYRHGWNSLQIQAVLQYTVEGRTFSGLLRTSGFKERDAYTYLDEAPKPTHILLRYNPLDHAEYRVLQTDNTQSFKLPLAIY